MADVTLSSSMIDAQPDVPGIIRLRVRSRDGEMHAVCTVLGATVRSLKIEFCQGYDMDGLLMTAWPHDTPGNHMKRLDQTTDHMTLEEIGVANDMVLSFIHRPGNKVKLPTPPVPLHENQYLPVHDFGYNREMEMYIFRKDGDFAVPRHGVVTLGFATEHMSPVVMGQVMDGILGIGDLLVLGESIRQGIHRRDLPPDIRAQDVLDREDATRKDLREGRRKWAMVPGRLVLLTENDTHRDTLRYTGIGIHWSCRSRALGLMIMPMVLPPDAVPAIYHVENPHEAPAAAEPSQSAAASSSGA
jgi:hypothetical protein